ncbi:hypothetical protein LCGC14_0390570 [marine sediment metagenome]|uniref:Uncharacterized protein n=1 Tax=marine sediment metagenome TaxID=412755 RepID=A0A0F9THQ8_9ZZZZ
MGFNLGGAITGGLGGFLVGGPAGAVIGAGLGSQAKKDQAAKTTFGTIPQTAEATESRKRLFELATGEPPEVPRQKIAPLPPRTEERDIARTTAKELIQPTDFMSLPEVQGIIQEARVTGDLLANRLSRMLQASGNLTSTTGRDVLGRAVTDVQKSLASSLAPFASEERARRTSLIPVLETLGLTEEERERGIGQAEFDAEFQQEFAESKQLETFIIPLLKSIIELQPGVQPIIKGDQPSSISQFAPLIGPLLTGILKKSPSATGGGFAGTNTAAGFSRPTPQGTFFA